MSVPVRIRRPVSAFHAGVAVGVLAAVPPVLGLLCYLATVTRRARLDPLTGLPHRDAMRRAHRRHTARGHPFSLLLVDLNGFKTVNDQHGHAAGDQLLCVVGTRLAVTARQLSGLAGRLGGDEFVVLLPAAPACVHLAHAHTIGQEIARPATILGHHIPVRLRVAGTIGVAAPAGRPDWISQLRAADIALYHARRTSSPFAVYRPGMPVPLHRDRLRAQHRDSWVGEQR